MAPPSPSSVADHLFGVGCRRRGEPARVDLFAPTCEQAWEAARLQLREALAGTVDDVEAAGLEHALHDLDHVGPQGRGWRCRVDGVEFWYGPTRVRRPADMSRGEAALLLALGVGRPSR